MLQTIRKAWAIPDLRKKIVFTALLLLIFRIGNAIPVPYVDTHLLGQYMDSMSGTIFGLFDVMSGGAFSTATLFALGVQPYINSSIIIQLLTIAIPALERLAREGGEEGRKKIQSITRYTTIGIAVLQGWGYHTLMKNYGILSANTGVWEMLVIIVSFVAGSAFVMWLGEQITEFGIGNGISVILFAGIVSRVPTMVSGAVATVRMDPSKWWTLLLIVVGVVALIVLITWVNGAERRIPVQYAKRQVGRKMYGGQSTNLPMKVNMSGVMPIIFAQSIAMIIPTIGAFTNPQEGTFWYSIVEAVNTNSVAYMIVYFILIIAFSYFYSSIQFNPIEISNNLKKNGGFIPGFRPGKPTADFIKKVLGKITLFGAIYLGVVAILPLILGKVVDVPSLSIGGTSVIIVVGVALETVQSLESQMLMRQYKGFLE